MDTQVIIVGAGVTGLSTAYHLARRGARRVLVLEKGRVGAGSSSRAAGIITGLLWSETGVLARAFARMVAESTDKTLALEREVAEHRRTEAARDHHAERERLFSAAVESSNDAIITMSLDGTITGWNSAAERQSTAERPSAAEAVVGGLRPGSPDELDTATARTLRLAFHVAT